MTTTTSSVAHRLAALQTPRERLAGWLRFVLSWLALPVLFFLTLTLGTVDLHLQRGAAYTVEETGTVAYVKECSEYGPISHAGFGFHWACSVDYGYAGHTLEPRSRETLSSVFTPADVGKTLAVEEIGKDLHRYHETGELTWAKVWVLVPIGFPVLALCYAGLRRWPSWMVPGLARRIKANPVVGEKFVAKLLREGRLVTRPYAADLTTAEVSLRRGYQVHLTEVAINGRRNNQPVWSLRRTDIEPVRLTALHAPGEHGDPVALVMDLHTVPRDRARHTPELNKHWGAMGIEGGCRFGYHWLR
ncbi:DUF6346 domain-containing protein [Amycolatopsis albispora]|uniref:Uncharacterized protein n=1 Tax=Amycolatopsis albispora TaxID=1804986 RepID=A0A344LF67_9PSEU|nr:DUF6346 domain-containing protein [Amycolatopsis albispora]AXB46691.1 hypothetical protein A4R43_33150 [Amycolatopsis albispora]